MLLSFDSMSFWLGLATEGAAIPVSCLNYKGFGCLFACLLKLNIDESFGKPFFCLPNIVVLVEFLVVLVIPSGAC